MTRADVIGRNLRFENLAFERGGQTLFEDVEFETSAGEVVGLVGRNGVGKTTLLGLAQGLLAPSVGRILLGDESVSTLSRLPNAKITSRPQAMTANDQKTL